MLDHIGQLMDSLRHVSDDIAHDLRTPLARLRAVLEEASDSANPEIQRSLIDKALIRMDSVIALFGTILRISEIERGAVRDHFAPMRLDGLAQEIIESYGPAAQDGGRSISASIAEGVTISGDEGLIGQAIVNLIENAIKHTPPGTSIMVTIAIQGERAILTVADDGPGVPAEDRPLVLRRFGRGEISRSTSGHGLGLTLVAAVAATHRAELILDDAAPGLAVSLVFPPQV
jgi:signal transduction histidine kinase